MITDEISHGRSAGESSHHRSLGCESAENASFSDADEDSWHSPFGSRHGGSYDESGVLSPEISGVSQVRTSSSSSSCCSEVDLENGITESNPHFSKTERNCRICHLNLESSNQESGVAIVLGCSCKDDLAAAHKQCAEAWFKIRGNKTCEICGATAQNVAGTTEAEFMDQWNETTNAAAHGQLQETRSFWQGHRFLNFLLACMVFAFVISWLFHFNVPS